MGVIENSILLNLEDNHPIELYNTRCKASLDMGIRLA